MKILLLIVLSTSISLSQNIFRDSIAGSVGTTDLEYAYATKGYQTTLSQGLDIKKGYSVQTLGSSQDGQLYYFEYKGLFREAKKDLACIILYAKNKTWGHEYYFCIPINNGTLASKFQLELSKLDSKMQAAYSYFASLNYAVVAK